MQNSITHEITQALHQSEALRRSAGEILERALQHTKNFTTPFFVSSKEAAMILRCTTRTLRNYQAQGRLTPYNRDGSPKRDKKNTHTFYLLQEVWPLK